PPLLPYTTLFRSMAKLTCIVITAVTTICSMRWILLKSATTRLRQIRKFINEYVRQRGLCRILRRNGLMCCAYQACEINRKLLLVRYSVVSVKRVVTYLSLFPAFHHLPSDRATLSASSPVFHPSQL